MGLGPSILSVIDERQSYSGPSYPSSPVVTPPDSKSLATFSHAQAGLQNQEMVGDSSCIFIETLDLFS